MDLWYGPHLSLLNNHHFSYHGAVADPVGFRPFSYLLIYFDYMIQLNKNTYEIDRPHWPDFLNNRPADSHKGHYGHALLVAGSYGKMGAAVLAARACLRSGVGLLTVHVPAKGVDIMQTAVPEAMVSIDSNDTHWTKHFLPDELSRYDAIATGPGLGTNSSSALAALLTAARGKAMVLDADAINMLASMEDKYNILSDKGHAAPTILTPHAKEFERLFGLYPDTLSRQQAQRAFSQQTACSIVYKSHRTQTSDAKGNIYFNSTGNPGMATAGSGDVLTGIILAILAQNKDFQLDTATCAIIGVWLHGKSGDLAREKQSECSIIAGDIIKFLPKATI